MRKINHALIISVISIIVISLFLSSCAKEEMPVVPEVKPECVVNTDCSVSDRCKTPICRMGKCSSEATDNCCGNGVCETTASESRCSCKLDCKPLCNGTVEFINTYGSKVKSTFFKYGCKENNCVIRYNASQIDPRQAYHTINQDSIVFGLMVEYIQPFEVNHGKVGIELQLKDYNAELLRTPVQITEIRVMENTLLLGRQTNIKKNLTKIGDIYTVDIPISYSMKMPEEKKRVTIYIDFKYMGQKKIVQMNGTKVMYDVYGQTLYKNIDTLQKITSTQVYLAEEVTFIDRDYDSVDVDFSDN